MKLEKKELQNLIEKVISAVSVTDNPIYQNIQISGKGDTIQAIATDRIKTLIYSIPSKNFEDFIFIVPAKLFLDVVRKAPIGYVEVSWNNKEVSVSSEGASWSLRVPVAQSLPVPDVGRTEEPIEVTSSSLMKAVEAVESTLSKTLNRPSLKMVNIDKGKATACDGTRFQQARIDGLPLDKKFLIPQELVRDVKKILEESETITITNSEKYITYETSNYKLISKRPTNSFPDVETLLLRPALENKHLLQVDCQDLRKAIKQVSVVSSEETHAVGLSLTKGNLTITSRDQLSNGASVTIPANWRLEDKTLVINYLDLLDMLKNYKRLACDFYLGKDSKSRRSVVVLRDDENGMIGVIPQMVGRFEVF